MPPRMLSAAVAAALLLLLLLGPVTAQVPAAIAVWQTPLAMARAYQALTNANTSTPALDAVEAGCAYLEQNPQMIGYSVGWDGGEDENGYPSLDALIMNGTTFEVGAVANLRGVRQAIRTARLVMTHTRHSILAGQDATQFALDMGVPGQTLIGEQSTQEHLSWIKGEVVPKGQPGAGIPCQPNYRVNVLPRANESCGPYRIDPNPSEFPWQGTVLPPNNKHDTTSWVAVQEDGQVAAASSTNGLPFKVPGRVGDSPIPGGATYADSDVGGCAATGNGDVNLRFLGCLRVVENMRFGMPPEEAITEVLRDIMSRAGGIYRNLQLGFAAMDNSGRYGAQCNGWMTNKWGDEAPHPFFFTVKTPNSTAACGHFYQATSFVNGNTSDADIEAFRIQSGFVCDFAFLPLADRQQLPPSLPKMYVQVVKVKCLDE